MQNRAENVNQDTDVVDMVPASEPVCGILPFPVELHGNAQFLLRRNEAARARGLHTGYVCLGDFAVLPDALGKRHAD
jgi:hypothetical protein